MDWETPLPDVVVPGTSKHYSDHDKIRAALMELRTNVDILSSTPGTPGSPGASVELRVEGANIEWRQVGGSWEILVPLSTLTGPSGVPALVTVNARTSNYILALADAGKAVEFSSTSALTATVPQNSSVAFPIGTIIEITRMNTGPLTIVAGTGTTLRSAGGLLALRAQYSAATIRKRQLNEWVVTGDLA